jgi:hypothetical protein
VKLFLSLVRGGGRYGFANMMSKQKNENKRDALVCCVFIYSGKRECIPREKRVDCQGKLHTYERDYMGEKREQVVLYVCVSVRNESFRAVLSVRPHSLAMNNKENFALNAARVHSRNKSF